MDNATPAKTATTPIKETATPSPQKSRHWLFAAIAAGVAVGLLLWWFTRAPVAVAVRVTFAPIIRTLQFSARVATLSRVDVGSTVTGRVLAVFVRESATVKKGNTLITMETEELQAAVAQAVANQRQSAARVAGLRSTGRSSAEAALAQSDSVLLNAQAELKRTEDLTAKGFLSAAKLDDVRRAVEVAQAQQANARAQRTANSDAGTDVAQAQAQLALANAASEAARARLAQATVTAPADGRVLARLVEPGQIVQPGRTLLTLALEGPLQLVAQVDERYLEQLQTGQTASVIADAFPQTRFAASVQSIAPLVDALRGAVEVKFFVPPPAPIFLREDMTLSVEVETARRDRALVVPVDAVRGGESSPVATLLIERDGRVEERRVRVGIRTLQSAEIIEGLIEGDIVLIGTAPKPGKRVRAEIASVPTAGSTLSSKARSDGKQKNTFVPGNLE